MKKKSVIQRYIPPLGIILLSILLFIFFFKTKPATVQKQIEEKIWFVEGQPLHLSNYQPSIKLIAKSISTEYIEITSAIEADVTQRWVSEGDRVSAGQKLITLDESTFKLLVAQRQAEQQEISAQIAEEQQRHKIDKHLLEREKSLLTIANNAVKRARTLEKSAMGSSSQLDDAKKSLLNQQIAIAQRQSAIDNHPSRLLQIKAKLKSAKSRLALAKKDLSHTKIFSPVNATITEITLDQGEHVRKGTSLIKLYNNKQLELKALAPEQYLPTITKAMQNNIPLTGFVTINKKTYPVKLARISGEIKENTAGSYLYFTAHGALQNLLLGQIFELQLTLPVINNTYALPSDALYGTNSIFIIEQQRLKRIPVVWLGETRSTNQSLSFLIKSDELKDGSLVLTSKFANAMEGLKVSVNTAQ